MESKFVSLLLIGRLCLLAQLMMITGVVDVAEAFVPHGGISVGSSRSFVPRSICAVSPLFYGNEGSANIGSSTGSRRGATNTKRSSGRRRNKAKGPTNKSSSQNCTENSQLKKVSRPASFAAIRKEMRNMSFNNNNDDFGVSSSTSQNVIDSATITRISRERHSEREQEQQARSLAKEERMELKLKVYQLSIDTGRGFQSTPQQAKEMKDIIDRLTALNPTTEPAWSYYGRTNPLTRQLYLSLANKKQKEEENDENDDLASLEGKWILTYTDVPSVVSLASDSNRLGFAKLGRIGQECTPFPDYTVRTIIEWKRPDWVKNLETNLPEGVSGWLFGNSESSVLQKTTLRARATPDDPTSWGVSSVPRAFEVVSSRSSSALYDDDEETSSSSSLSFVTDDGLLALDPLKPLKIGLQIAGRNGEQGLFVDGNEKAKSKATGTSLVTKDGLVALNPFQPWTVGLQMAGFARRENGTTKLGTKANEPWKIAEEGEITNNQIHHHNNLFEDINERGLVEGVLKQTPIQFPTPDAVASLLEDDKKKVDSKPQSSGKQRILYLDDDIRIIGDGENHITIESRACTDEDEECWF